MPAQNGNFMLPAQRRLEEGLQQVNGPHASPEECTKLSRGSNGNGHTGGHRQCSGECAGQVPMPRWGGGGPRGTPSHRMTPYSGRSQHMGDQT